MRGRKKYKRNREKKREVQKEGDREAKGPKVAIEYRFLNQFS